MVSLATHQPFSRKFVIMRGYNTGAFNSRRSPVMVRDAMIATAQPLATTASLRILLEGGNAVDAAVAAAAVLGVTEPYQTGLGGDCFALIYSAKTKTVRALNASGPAPRSASVAEYASRGLVAMPEKGPLSWTVPGCVDGWCEMVSAHGSMPLSRLLAPAIGYAAGGFPVSPADARAWGDCVDMLSADEGASRCLLIDGRAPRAGEVFVQPALARSLRLVAEGGREAYYEGDIARELAALSDRLGGFLTREDLAAYHAEWQQPIGIDYRGMTILECPPNGGGIAALLALRAVEDIDFTVLDRTGPECLHILIEATKHAMTVAGAYVADPLFARVPVAELLAAPPVRLALPSPMAPPIAWESPAYPPGASDTVFLAVVDAQGNAVAFINSVYGSFGSCSTAEKLGFPIQNRGYGFTLEQGHPNQLEGGKRPYHTIIPAMAMQNGTPSLLFGMTGGFLQPQGHLQLVVNLLDYGMDPQSAIDMPRFWWQGHRDVIVENGFPEEAYATLMNWGHLVMRRPEHRGFGGAQVIRIDHDRRVLIAGSEPRQDGCAIGY
jgi:gamma-glutamyltranspeptidase / glutathione hydrolase